MPYIDCIVTLIAFLAWAALFYGPWQETCIAWARQQVFEARDQLFDLALAGKLDFDSTTYRTLRRTLEGTIRFAHELDFFLLLKLMLVLRNSTRPNLLQEALKQVDDAEVRIEIERLFNRANQALYRMMVQRSCLLMLLLPFAALYNLYAEKAKMESRNIVKRVVLYGAESSQCDLPESGLMA